MKLSNYLILALFASITISSQVRAECPGEKKLNSFLTYHFPLLSLTAYNDSCSQITEGDFNRDGKFDIAVVLTEVQPTAKYANGDEWYRTYILVMLAGELPYNEWQSIFVRTDGNKPKRFTVEAVVSEDGTDLLLIKKNYSHTRYKWTDKGFQAIEHSAD